MCKTVAVGTSATNSIDRAIGSNVRMLRFRAGLSVGKVSALMHVDSAVWEDWEAGRTRIGPSELFGITKVLEANVSDIYAGIVPRPDVSSDDGGT